MTELGRLRAVLDTNVVFAGLFSRNPRSPTAEVLQRWYSGEFDLLYCEDLRLEYREKLAAASINPVHRARFLARLARLGIRVPLSPAETLPRVSAGPDDDAVIACALVGGATHNLRSPLAFPGRRVPRGAHPRRPTLSVHPAG